MGSNYSIPSDASGIRKLKKQLDNQRNLSKVSSTGVNVSERGTGVSSKDSAFGAIHGPLALDPVKCNVGSYDHYDANWNPAAGAVWRDNVKDSNNHYHVRLQSANMIVTGTDSTIDLWYIDGSLHNGQTIRIKSDQGKTLTIKAATNTSGTAGNFSLANDVPLPVTFYLDLSEDDDTGSFGGMWIQGIASSGSGSGTLWSDITIDVSKNMLGFGLTDLGFITLLGDTTSHHTDYFMSSNFNIMNLVDTDHTNIGFALEINGGGYFQIVHNTAATPFTDFLYAQVPFNMNNFIIYNIDDLRFHSTGNIQQINTSGDGKVFNFLVDGLDLMHFSHNGSFIGNAAVLELFSNASDSTSFPSYKAVNVKTPAVNGRLIGEYAFDGPNSSGTQITYAKIQAFTANVPAGNEAGLFSFFVLHSGSMEEEMELSQNGLDMLNHDIIGVRNFKFFLSGGSVDASKDMITTNAAGNMYFNTPTVSGTKSVYHFQENAFDIVIFDPQANILTSYLQSIQIVPPSGHGWSIAKFSGTPAVYTATDGHQFDSPLYSGGVSGTIGDFSNFWPHAYVTQLHIGNANSVLDLDGSGNFHMNPSSGKSLYLGPSPNEMIISSGTITATPYDALFNSVQASLYFILLNGGIDPFTNGMFEMNGSDVKVMSGSVVKNFTQMPQLNANNSWTLSNQFFSSVLMRVQQFLVFNNNDTADTYIRQSTGVGTVPKKLDIAAFADICFQGVGENTTALSRGLVKGMQQSGDPTTTQIPSGYFTVNKNTSSGAVKLWYNDSGTLRSVTLT